MARPVRTAPPNEPRDLDPLLTAALAAAEQAIAFPGPRLPGVVAAFAAAARQCELPWPVALARLECALCRTLDRIHDPRSRAWLTDIVRESACQAYGGEVQPLGHTS